MTFNVLQSSINSILNLLSINVDELNKLTNEGFGVYVDKNQMEKDKVLDQKKCFSAFIKNDICDIDIAIFRTVGDTDCDSQTYETNYDKPMDLVMKNPESRIQITWLLVQNLSQLTVCYRNI